MAFVIFGIAGVFTLIGCVSIIYLMFSVLAQHGRAQDAFTRKHGIHITEEDFWDDVDGGTYVTMADGTIRLDNNGNLR